ncbi:MAG: septum formation inhibitor Maf [Desulfobulbaceae bacterium]|nr:septum formation inhibitor Maf [Desulfobulbaceae bacterium]
MEGGFETIRQLVLASASPRRQRFLKELGLKFDVQVSSVDEELLPGESPKNYVLRLAIEKGQGVMLQRPEAFVLAADTVVVLEGQILGKPSGCDDAVNMLLMLSGRWHEVWTGFCICCRSEKMRIVKAVRTKVLFRSLNRALCEAYALTGEPLDKAGSYGLQGRGGFLVDRIEGSYSNVIGLPVAEVVAELLSAGVVKPITKSFKEGIH